MCIIPLNVRCRWCKVGPFSWHEVIRTSHGPSASPSFIRKWKWASVSPTQAHLLKDLKSKSIFRKWNQFYNMTFDHNFTNPENMWTLPVGSSFPIYIRPSYKIGLVVSFKSWSIRENNLGCLVLQTKEVYLTNSWSLSLLYVSPPGKMYHPWSILGFLKCFRCLQVCPMTTLPVPHTRKWYQLKCSASFDSKWEGETRKRQ